MSEINTLAQNARPGLTAAFNWRSWKTWWIFLGFAVLLGASSAVLTIGAKMVVVSAFDLRQDIYVTNFLSALLAALLHFFALVAFGKAIAPKAPGSTQEHQSEPGFIVGDILKHPKDRLFLLAWIFVIWAVIYGLNALSIQFLGLNAGMILAFGAVIIVIGMDYPIRVLQNAGR